MHTVNNSAYKWVSIQTCTEQCPVVKHMQISPIALNWKAMAFPAKVTFEFSSDFDIRGPPVAKDRFKGIAHLGGFTRNFDGFMQRSL